jgi:predicted hotdog family 3-hydroxylacyl-ACP dehydratase
MCLLHEVIRWDADSINCRARSHRDPANPLRSREQLAAVHGVEYAAQAMALHGALLGGAESPASRPGYIGAVRALELHARRLDDIAEDLTIHADRLVGDASHVLYAFSIRAGERLLVAGRISVALGIAA